MDPSEAPGMREMICIYSEVSHRAFMSINCELWIHYTTTSLNRTSVCELGFDWTFPVWPGWSFGSIGCSLLCQEAVTSGDAVTVTSQRQTNRAALHCLFALQPSLTPTEDVTVVHQIAAPCSSLSETRKHVSVFISEIQSYVVVFKMFDCEVLTKRGVRQTKKQKKSIRIHPAGWSLREKHIQVKTTKLHIWIWLLSIWR